MLTIKQKFSQKELIGSAEKIFDNEQLQILSVFPTEGGRLFFVLFLNKQNGKQKSKKVTIWQIIDCLSREPVNPESLDGEMQTILFFLQLSYVPKTLAEAKKAYRNAVKIHHPDKGGDASMFRLVQESYHRLKKRVTEK